jgi:hypothetical protein
MIAPEESAPPPDPPEVTIPLRSLRRERAQLLQKLQHAVPAAALLLVGAQRVMQHERGLGLAMAVAEIVVGVVLFRSLAKAFAATKRSRALAAASGSGAHAGHRHGIDWIDVLIAAVLVFEALEHWREHHHVPGPTVLLAAVTLGLGLFHGRLTARKAGRRVLRIDAAGIRFRGGLFRKFFASWNDVEGIDLGERWARISLRGGEERRINLYDLRNGHEVRAALAAARGRLPPPEAVPDL